ncbi:vesicle-trafficking protein SEC22c-like [Latimeria chalumnae]|uniref:vesicle-trafficking protein SEC22c-like n=1 Tax=Latimeria chalumnae TaxID=7897 RepID=UPI00313C65D6
MTMILFACVTRVRDGLPLSASTDFEHCKELQECKRHLKVLCGTLEHFPDRGVLEGNALNIHFSCCEGIAYMIVCPTFYPTAMAFCFLEELRWEFTASYDGARIGLASRPYAFLDFDCVIQKLRKRYNYSSCPVLRVSLAGVKEDLRLRPPQLLKLEDVEEPNGMTNGHVHQHAETGDGYRPEPVSTSGILSLVLNIMCAALNLIRGAHLVEHSFQEDSDGMGNAAAFLLAFAVCLFQCYLYVFYGSARKLKTFAALSLLCLCNIYLYGPRNSWQVLFHI